MATSAAQVASVEPTDLARLRMQVVDLLLDLAQTRLQIARDSGDPESGFQGAVLADAATILLRDAAIEAGVTPL